MPHGWVTAASSQDALALSETKLDIGWGLGGGQGSGQGPGRDPEITQNELRLHFCNLEK